MASEHEILDVVAVMAGIYGKEPGDMRGFYWSLADVDADILERTSRAWVKREKWMPSPAELAQECEQAQRGRHEYWRHVDLYGQLLRGERDDERTERAVREYFGLDRT